MHISTRRLLVALSLLGTTAASAAPLTVATYDGLVVTVAEDGGIDGVTLDGASLPVSGRGGFFLSEVTAASTPLPYDGTTRAGVAVTGSAVQTAADEVTITSTLSNGFKVTGVLKGGPALSIDATVENLNGGDRALTVYFRLP